MKLVAKAQSFKTYLKNASWLQICLFAVTVVLGISYIWQVNVAATRGFTMRDLESDIHDLQLENERLSMEASRLQSIDSVSTRIQMLGMNKVNRVEYLTPGEGVVAINY